MILSNFMLINMLIAMMASTYEQVRENSETYFMAGKARHTFRWSNYPAAFPPFNLLSLPYMERACHVAKGGAEGGDGKGRCGDEHEGMPRGQGRCGGR